MTTRTDAHLAALLRHLGAAYYESLHGQASEEDVTEAVDSVTEHLKERGGRPVTAAAEPWPAAAADEDAAVHPGQPRFAPDAGRTPA